MSDTVPPIDGPEASDAPPSQGWKVARTQNFASTAYDVDKLEKTLVSRKIGKGAQYWRLLDINRVWDTERDGGATDPPKDHYRHVQLPKGFHKLSRATAEPVAAKPATIFFFSASHFRASHFRASHRCHCRPTPSQLRLLVVSGTR